jgi:hypothetical protein
MRRFPSIILQVIIVLTITTAPIATLAGTSSPDANEIIDIDMVMTPEAWMIASVEIIGRQWVPAYDPSKNSVKNLYMSYRVDDKGNIIYSKLAYTTGDVVLDKALEDSFKKIVKLPPPPKALMGNKVYRDFIYTKGEDVPKSGTGVIHKKETALNNEHLQYSSGGRTPFYYKTERFMMAISIIEANEVIKGKSIKGADLNIWSMSVFDSLGKALPPFNDSGKKKKVSVVYEFNISGYGIISGSKMIKAADMADVDIVIDRILGNGGRLNPPPIAGKYYIMLEMMVNS